MRNAQKNKRFITNLVFMVFRYFSVFEELEESFNDFNSSSGFVVVESCLEIVSQTTADVIAIKTRKQNGGTNALL